VRVSFPRSRVLRERRRVARVHPHANGQTSAESTPAPPPPRVP